MLYAKYLCNGVESDVPAGSVGPQISNQTALMVAGPHAFSNNYYDCSKQGLYRFIDTGTGLTINKVTYAPTIDYYAFISGMCHNHVHGVDDEQTLASGAYDFQIISNHGIYGKWRNRCGVIAGLAAWYFGLIGGTARVINVKTLGPLTGFDDGHLVLETLHGNNWRMWDLTNHCYFVDAGGVHLSTAAFISAIANGGAMPARISLDGHLEPTFFTHGRAGNIDLSLYSKYGNVGDDNWFRRVFQVIY